MTSIKLHCRGAGARADVSGQLTHAMVGIPVTAELDEAWDGLYKTVKVRCAEVCRTAILDEKNQVILPYECLIAGQRLEIGIDGTDAEGKLRIPSSWASCGIVKPSVAQCDGPEGAPPTVDAVTQLQILTDKAENAAREAVESKDAADASADSAAVSAQDAGEAAAQAEESRNRAENGARAAVEAADRFSQSLSDYSEDMTLPVGMDDQGRLFARKDPEVAGIRDDLAAKYTKPGDGIPEADLSAPVAAKLHSIVTLTQAAYDSIAVPNPDTYYCILEES